MGSAKTTFLLPHGDVMEKILVIGANGFLGGKLHPIFKNKYDVYAADITISEIDEKFHPIQLDITNAEQVKTIFNRLKPNLTILTAAMTNVDVCEDFPEKANLINANGPLNVANAIKEINGRLIHLSTDFIFDGEKGNYTEEEEPNPLGVYGESKLLGEKHILESGVTALICRTSVLYGWPAANQRDNFFSWAYKQLHSGKHIKIIKGQITTPTLVDDLAQFLYDVSEFQTTEIYHTTGPEAISRYDFVSKLVDIFEMNPNLLESVDFFKQKAPRPDDSSLNTQKIQLTNYHRFRGIEASFQYLKEQK
ncbi:NAD(P)-dependent oxidoreductase [Candidatus Lokiarchaeum ossiferum]|uniref:NAD(P)-dependent oxidoreductase n=1 Tax=Candidatus Lokiarchaeum ossiferum TaxID=2951803 RepID=UPI00352C4FBC